MPEKNLSPALSFVPHSPSIPEQRNCLWDFLSRLVEITLPVSRETFVKIELATSHEGFRTFLDKTLASFMAIKW
jgi:hypothetical protein